MEKRNNEAGEKDKEGLDEIRIQRRNRLQRRKGR